MRTTRGLGSRALRGIAWVIGIGLIAPAAHGAGAPPRTATIRSIDVAALGAGARVGISLDAAVPKPQMLETERRLTIELSYCRPGDGVATQLLPVGALASITVTNVGLPSRPVTRLVLEARRAGDRFRASIQGDLLRIDLQPRGAVPAPPPRPAPRPAPAPPPARPIPQPVPISALAVPRAPLTVGVGPVVATGAASRLDILEPPPEPTSAAIEALRTTGAEASALAAVGEVESDHGPQGVQLVEPPEPSTSPIETLNAPNPAAAELAALRPYAIERGGSEPVRIVQPPPEPARPPSVSAPTIARSARSTTAPPAREETRPDGELAVIAPPPAAAPTSPPVAAPQPGAGPSRIEESDLPALASDEKPAGDTTRGAQPNATAPSAPAPAPPAPAPPGRDLASWATLPPHGPPATRLLAVERLSDGTLRLVGDGQFAYSTHRLDDPPRVIIDLEDVIDGTDKPRLEIDQGLLGSVHIAQIELRPRSVTRVTFDLRGAATASVESTADGLRVRFLAPARATPPGP